MCERDSCYSYTQFAPSCSSIDFLKSFFSISFRSQKDSGSYEIEDHGTKHSPPVKLHGREKPGLRQQGEKRSWPASALLHAEAAENQVKVTAGSSGPRLLPLPKPQTPDSSCTLDTCGPLIINETRSAKEPTAFLGTTENIRHADRASVKTKAVAHSFEGGDLGHFLMETYLDR